PDDIGGGRRRQHAAAADDRALRAVGGEHAQDGPDGRVVEKAPVAADDDRSALDAADALDRRLHVVLEIARLHEYGGLLSQPGGSRLLTFDRRRANCLDGHLLSPISTVPLIAVSVRVATLLSPH